MLRFGSFDSIVEGAFHTPRVADVDPDFLPMARGSAAAFDSLWLAACVLQQRQRARLAILLLGHRTVEVRSVFDRSHPTMHYTTALFSKLTCKKKIMLQLITVNSC